MGTTPASAQTLANHHYAIFGDMNQQGAISGTCKSSQNERGGLFFVIDDPDLSDSVKDLISGDSATTQIPKPAQQAKK